MLKKNRSKNEIYNELDGEIVNVFKVLRDKQKSNQLIQLLELTPFSRDEMDIAWQECDCEIERARRTLVRSQMGFGSAGATKARTGFRGLDNCDNSFSAPARQWAGYPKSLEAIIKRLQGVVIENTPALDLIEKTDRENTLYYIDPPYMPETRSSMKGGIKYYRHEMTKHDHKILLKKIRTLKGMVIISGYNSKLYNLYLKNWTKKTFNSRSASSAGGIVREECVWISPNIAADLFSIGAT